MQPVTRPQEFDHAEFLRSPDRWPAWPVCPLKRPARRKEDWIECGVVIDQEEHRWTVYLTNLFMLPGGLEDCERIPYGSLEELLHDGWVVD